MDTKIITGKTYSDGLDIITIERIDGDSAYIERNRDGDRRSEVVSIETLTTELNQPAFEEIWRFS